MKSRPTARANMVLGIVAAVIFVSTLVGLIARAAQAREGGESERADAIVAGTAIAIGIVVLVSILATLIVYCMLVPAKRTAKRLKTVRPGAVTFIVSSPSSQGVDWPDNLNGPELLLPYTMAAAFSADANGLAWWSAHDLKSPRGLIQPSRVIGLNHGTSGKSGLTQLVVRLANPESTKRLTVISEDSNGFRLVPVNDFAELVDKIADALGLDDLARQPESPKA